MADFVRYNEDSFSVNGVLFSLREIRLWVGSNAGENIHTANGALGLILNGLQLNGFNVDVGLSRLKKIGYSVPEVAVNGVQN